MHSSKKTFGIYTVEDEYDDNGRWIGYKCSVTAPTGKQGKLYIKTDGREYYQEKKKDEELEI